jgi:prepilin-type processing-associated H-X9-DG protein
VNQHELALFLCPSAPPGRKGARGRGILDYPAITQLTRPNPFYTAYRMPPSDSTYIGILGKNVLRKMVDIKDGTSTTLMLAESAGRNAKWVMGQQVSNSGLTGAWANPGTQIAVSGFNTATKTTPGSCAVNCTNANEIYSFHTSGANGLFGDGSVRTIPASADVNIIIPLMTRAGGEPINLTF